MANAKTGYVIAERWKHFVPLAEQDKEFRQYREFLRLAEPAIDDLAPKQRFAASGFLTEIKATMASLDPLASSDQLLPKASEPRLDYLSLKRSGFSGDSSKPRALHAANSEAILSVIGAAPGSDTSVLRLGRLSVDDSFPVDVPLSRLFGRHLAVVVCVRIRQELDTRSAR